MVRRIKKFDASNPAILKYLKKKRYHITFQILNNGIHICNGRSHIIDEKIYNYRNYLLNPKPYKEDISFEILESNINLLELLSSIFMLLEEYLGYSNNIKKPLEEFPKHIASKNMTTASDEIKYLKALKQKEVLNYLNFTEVSCFNVDKNDIELIKKVYRKTKIDIFMKIKRILEFYDKYYGVYIKYKHILPAILGIHSKKLDYKRNNYEINSNIYIRAYNKNKDEYTTYIISCGIESLNYYEEIKNDIVTVFQLLLLSYIHFMMNMEKPFLVPINTYVEKESISQLESLIRKTNKIKSSLPDVNIQIKENKSFNKRLALKLARETIYKMKKDIFK